MPSIRALPHTAFAVACLLTLLASLGCQRTDPVETNASSRVESPELGFALASLPGGFQVAANDETGLELEGPAGATLRVEVGPEAWAGINLVEEVRKRKAWFEEGGTYFGNRELMTPIGTAFTARGTYSDPAGVEVEETWVYAVHPSANRLLTLTYTYPTGQSQERVQELISVLGEIEGTSSVEEDSLAGAADTGP